MMKNVTSSTAMRLATRVTQSEEALSRALNEVVRLFSEATSAQSEFPDAPIHEAFETMKRLHKLSGNLMDARADMLRIHGKLSHLSQVVGITEDPYCPPNSAVSNEAATITAIAA